MDNNEILKSLKKELDRWCETRVNGKEDINFDKNNGSGKTHIRFTTDKLNSIIPPSNDKNRGWKNGHSIFYEINNRKHKNSDKKYIFIYGVASSKDLTEEERIKCEELIRASEKKVKSNWDCCSFMRWEIYEYENEKFEVTVKNVFERLNEVFENDIKEFEEKVLSKVIALASKVYPTEQQGKEDEEKNITIKEKFLEYLDNKIDKIITTEEVHKNISENIRPTDYCYNRVNIGSLFKELRLEYISKGEFMVLGGNYDYTGVIYHKRKGSSENDIRVIGCWENGKIISINDDKISELIKIQNSSILNLSNIVIPKVTKANVIWSEGTKRIKQSIEYERDPRNRKKAIKIHGTKCKACGFDFDKVYGKYGEGYIEIHHKTPLSTSGKVNINPETDLVPLCSNCHRMIHRKRDTVLSINELKEVIEQNK